MQHVETGVVVFIGLHLLLIWRFLAWNNICGSCLSRIWPKRLDYAGFINYTVSLYVLLFVMLVYAISLYLELDDWAAGLWGYVATMGSGTAKSTGGGPIDGPSVSWLPPFCTGAVISVALTYVCSLLQAMQHLERIERGRAEMQHDRAIQVIAMPAVYGVMAVSALTEISQLVKSGGAKNPAMRRLALSKSEACFRVGDLYEAWVLFQFGRLTMSLILSSIRKQENSIVDEERAKARGLLMAHEAVESLTWLGTWMFCLVCVFQSGWSLWMLAFAKADADFERTNEQFAAAGMVASASAIWNVHVVESSYSEYLHNYSPYVKFFSVKVLVSLAFFQRGAFWSFQYLRKTLPGLEEKMLDGVPLVGDILRLDEVEFELFFSALILYEIMFIAVLHLFAWGVDEQWYLDFYCIDLISYVDMAETERWPLLPSEAKLTTQSMGAKLQHIPTETVQPTTVPPRVRHDLENLLFKTSFA
jgi:hypothetical protein